MRPPVIVITNCTNRKRVAGNPVTLSQNQLSGSLDTVAKRWVKALKKAPHTQHASNVYMGRAFSEANSAAALVGGDLYVVSAGLGLIKATDQIPAYDLTVAEGSSSLGPLLSGLNKTSADWWSVLINELGPSRSIRSLVETHTKTLMLFALPAGYVALIAQELSGLTAKQAEHIRIITSELGVESVPPKLRHVVLPYDERLEGSNYAGTRTDFPQRALRHFVEELNGHALPLDKAQADVRLAMNALRKPVLPVRAKKSDEEILALLQKNWNRFDGASTRLLRFLRDDALVACEQSRFRSLWLQLQDKPSKRG
jgi:hypothetical protein